MQNLLLTNIRQLVNVREDTGPLYGIEMAELPFIENAWLLIEGNFIAGFGKMDTLNNSVAESSCRKNGLQRKTGDALLVRQSYPPGIRR